MTENGPSRPPGLLALILLAAASISAPALGDDKPSLAADHAAAMARGLDLFKAGVRATLADRCLKCHGGASTKGEFDLATREALLEDKGEGAAVVPGDHAASRLYRMIAHLEQPAMPAKAPKLADDAIKAVADWIDAGAPYDRPLLDPSAPPSPRAVVTEADRRFWSFAPLAAVPPAAGTIDRLLGEKLRVKGITPNPAADRRVLIRRASFGLLGLPPSPEESEAFVLDPAPDAFDRLVDRLLARPALGERWARHWLDLARFAESHGYEHDYDRPTAYHYRDFLVRALNDDMPYDRFVRLQVAGDELEPANPQALMATGFLAAGVHSTQITANTAEKERYDEMDDMAATLGTAMLGLTVGCARCHDHKFDPIPTADYYRLVATFTTTVRSEADLDLDPDRTARDLADHERLLTPLRDARDRDAREAFPSRLAAWLQTRPEPRRPRWLTLEASSLKSDAGATFAPDPDGSYQATGPNPESDVYTFEARTPLRGLTALRLEALADPKLKKKGPGRASNGNFALSDIKVTAAPLAGGGPAVPVKLTNARATFEQAGLPVVAAIDADPHSSWAVDPQFGRDHAAVFDFAEPVGFEGGTTLTVRLSFAGNTGHTIGRPRLAVTTDPGSVPLDGDSGSIARLAKLEAALKTPDEARTADQSDLIAAHFRTIDPESVALDRAVADREAKAPKAKLTKVLIASEGVPPLRLHTQGADFFEKTYLLKRGDLAQKQAETSAGFLQVLTLGDDARWRTPPPPSSKQSYRRTGLANWLTDVDAGAGRLLARVIVNRLWQHHFGRGLVATPSDFGTQGERPSHPELLDYLAAELIRQGWRLKPIHRLMMTSDAYRQSSAFDDSKAKLDPDDLLRWRQVPRRLEAEAIRDAMLAVSGMLDTTPFGPGTLDEDMTRRSLYFTVKRSHLIPTMTLFDAPDALGGLGQRSAATVAPQALAMLNSPRVRAFRRGIRPSGPTRTHRFRRRTRSLVRTASPSAAPPRLDELADALAFLQSQPEATALPDFCQAILGLNEFIYVD